MFLYVLNPIISLISGIIFRLKEIKYKEKAIIFLGLSFFIPFYIGAFRDPVVGIDTYSYVLIFQWISDLSLEQILLGTEIQGTEVGYMILCKLISLASTDPMIFLVFTSFLMNALFVRAIYKLSLNPYMSSFIYMAFLFDSNLNIMRQAIAVGILLNALVFLFKAQNLKYVLCVLVATSIHTFSISFLILVPVATFVNTRKKLILLLIILAGMVSSSIPFFDYITSNYFYHFAYYFRNDFNPHQSLGLGSFYIIGLSMFMLFIMIRNWRNNCCIFENRMTVVFCSSILLAILFLIMMTKFGILERCFRYFNSLLILSVPYALKRLADSYSYISYYLFVVLLVSFICFYAYHIFADPYQIVPFTFY